MNSAKAIEEFKKTYDGNLAEHIAVIGMTGRFPGARNVDEFWQNLRDGVESITFFSSQDLVTSNLDPSLLANPKYVGADGIIDDMDMFDADFFGHTPREAELMDPQHRLFLECAWEAMESAGYDSESCDGRVAVYASANLSSYLIRNIMANPELRATATSFHTLLGNDKDFIATRVSYKLNLKGPSLSVATLCSSSFVAIHLACQSLLNYQCDLAMAGSISLQVSPNEAFFYQEGGIGDPQGHCRAFDAKANGTVSGSGIGIVVLKRLEDALADGDFIRAIIRGTAVNNDGAMKVSYTAPSVEGQAEVIAEAMALAEVNAETVTYVETHGTGTHLGDPIEVEALTKAFRADTQKKGFCAIGSVKTNIGHLVNAGGVASLIKTILALENQLIPPSLNFETANPQIDFANSPFYVNTRLREWKTQGFPRRAGVSSFGIGGTNVHLIVEESPQFEPSEDGRQYQVVLLSAKTSLALEKQTTNLVDYLQRVPNTSLADVTYTLQVGRRAFNYRRVCLCQTVEDAIKSLSGLRSGHVWTQFQGSKDRPVVFLFAGGGGQLTNTSLELYQCEPTFREQVDQCARILQDALQLDVRQVLFYSEAYLATFSPLQQSVLRQTAVFVQEYALAMLWQEWGIQPESMMGEGVGEYVAAHLAGVFSLEDALGLVVAAARMGETAYWPVEMVNQFQGVQFHTPQAPYISAASGNWVSEKQICHLDYWRTPLTHSHRSAEGVQLLLQEPEQVLLEVGMEAKFLNLTARHPGKTEHQIVLASLDLEQPEPSDMARLLTTVGKLWLAGVRVDWNGLHAHEHRHRLPLPTYPFERKRYWIEPVLSGKNGTLAGTRPEKRVAQKEPDIANWFYLPSWKRTLWPVRPPQNDASSWLLFMDEQGIGDQLVKRLKQEDHSIMIVYAGKQFTEQADGTFTLDPGSRTDYDRLFQKLATDTLLPQKIVHLWSLTPLKAQVSDFCSADKLQESGFYSLLFLAQALGQRDFTEHLELNVITNYLYEVTSVDELCPEKATLLGPAKVISQEYPHIVCRTIDFGKTDDLHTLGERLIADLKTKPTDPAIAYRGHQRWVQTFEPIALDQSTKALSSPWRANRVYLIFNGLDGIGYTLAAYLAQNTAVKLAVTNHLKLPSRDARIAWPGIEKDQTSQQIQHVQQLEKLGVVIIEVDMTRPEQVETAIMDTERQLGPLNGIIYTTADFSQASLDFIKETDKTTCERPLQQVLHTLPALEKAIRNKNLDFCLLHSSLASVLGGLGLVRYTAVHNFLDAFAHQANQQSATPWLTINWDSWQLDEKQTGSLSPGNHLNPLAMTPSEGFDALERVMSQHLMGQIVISMVDLHTRLRQWVAAPGESPPELVITFHDRPGLPTPYVAPRNSIEQTLSTIWEKSMGVKPVGIHDDFFELGGDSLLGVQIISQVREAFSMDIPLGNLFQQPTIAFLADYIETISWATRGESNAKSSEHEQRREEIAL